MPDRLAEEGQDFITDQVPVSIIVLFKEINIHHYQAEWTFLNYCPFSLFMDQFQEICMIKNASQAIDVRLFLDQGVMIGIIER